MKLCFDEFNESEIARIRLGIRQNGDHKNRLIDGLIKRDKPISITIPHKIYHASVETIITRNNVSDFVCVGKQYLIVNEHQVIGVVGLIDSGKDQVSVKMNYGEYAHVYKDLFVLLDKIELPFEFNFSILKIPELYLNCAWLVAKEEQFFVPLKTVSPELEAFTLYKMKDFFRKINTLPLKT